MAEIIDLNAVKAKRCQPVVQRTKPGPVLCLAAGVVAVLSIMVVHALFSLLFFAGEFASVPSNPIVAFGNWLECSFVWIIVAVCLVTWLLRRLKPLLRWFN